MCCGGSGQEIQGGDPVALAGGPECNSAANSSWDPGQVTALLGLIFLFYAMMLFKELQELVPDKCLVKWLGKCPLLWWL